MAAKAVLVALADHTKADKGWCAPGIERLSMRLSMNERTVRRAILELKDAGHVTVQHRKGTSSIYFVHPLPRTESPDLPRTQSPESGHESPDFVSPTPDSVSARSGLSVQEPRTQSPTNHTEPVSNRKKQPPARAVVVLSSNGTKKSGKRKPTAVPADFKSSPAVRQWSLEHGYEDPDLHLRKFIEWARTADARVWDHDKTFMDQIERNIGGLPRAPKQKYDLAALAAMFPSEAVSTASSGGDAWSVLNRLTTEELQAKVEKYYGVAANTSRGQLIDACIKWMQTSSTPPFAR